MEQTFTKEEAWFLYTTLFKSDLPSTLNETTPSESDVLNKPQAERRALESEIPYVCLAVNCSSPVQSQRRFCRAHGNLKRCAFQGCHRGPQSGGYCITHGGGRRCTVSGCQKAVQTGGLCKAHGGGVRCKVSGCERSSQGGGFCRAHGGGRRCAYSNCCKGVQRGNFCARHGGYRLCSVKGCYRTDRGRGYCDFHRNLSIAPSCTQTLQYSDVCKYQPRHIGIMPQVGV